MARCRPRKLKEMDGDKKMEPSMLLCGREYQQGEEFVALG